MAYIHVPESKLNDIIRWLERNVARQGGWAAGRAVEHATYTQVKALLDKHNDDGDHKETQTKQPPFGYALLLHKLHLK